MTNTYRLKVDLKLRQSGIIPTFVQYDTARLEFQIFDNGKVFDLSSFNSVEFAHKKPDGSVIVGTGQIETIDGKQIVSYDYQGSEMNNEGVVETSFSLLGSNNKKISVQTFKVKIVTDNRDSALDPANPEYSKLQEYSVQMESIILEADTSVANAKEMKFVDAYNVSTAYKKNNTITFNGESYMAKKATTGNAPTGQATDPNWSLMARKGADGTGTVVRHRDVFTATAGQTEFTLSKTYDQFQNRIDVTVGNVPQFSPDNFVEASSNKIRFTTGLSAGDKVIASYFSTAQPLKTDLETQVNGHTTSINNANSLLSQHDTKLTQVSTQLADTVKKGETGVLSLNVFTEEDRAAIQGLADGEINAVLGKGNVKPENTDFFKEGKNLLNPDSLITGKVLSSGGVLLTNSSFSVTPFYDASPSTYYAFTNTRNFIFYDANENVLYYELGTPVIQSPAATRYMRVSVENTKINTAMVEQNSQKTAYEPRRVFIPKELTEAHEVEIDTNDFSTTAILSGSPNSFNVDLANEKIVTTAAGGFISFGQGRDYLANAEFDFSTFSFSTVIVAYSIVAKTFNFYSITEYSALDKTAHPLVGLIRRGEANVFIFGTHSINGANVMAFTTELKERIENTNPAPPSSVESVFILTDIIGNEYLPQSPYIPVSENTTFQDIYDLYDALVTAYPDYISRTLLGNDGQGNPIYRYDFNAVPPIINDGRITYNQPKLYYQTGIHGHEKNATMAAYLFFKELCENWRNDKALRALRHNLSFIVVPVLNPSGFNLNQRKNANGVDLNRNWPSYWSLETDTESDKYGGAEPLSEPETQYVDELMRNESNIIFAIDNHNSGGFGGQPGNYCYWAGSNIEKVQKLAAGLAYQMSAHVQEEYSQADQSNISFSMVSKASGGTTTMHWESFGIPALLLETTENFMGSPEDTQKANAYFIGNTILGAVKNYDSIKQP